MQGQNKLLNQSSVQLGDMAGRINVPKKSGSISCPSDEQKVTFEVQLENNCPRIPVI